MDLKNFFRSLSLKNMISSLDRKLQNKYYQYGNFLFSTLKTHPQKCKQVLSKKTPSLERSLLIQYENLQKTKRTLTILKNFKNLIKDTRLEIDYLRKRIQTRQEKLKVTSQKIGELFWHFYRLHPEKMNKYPMTFKWDLLEKNSQSVHVQTHKKRKLFFFTFQEKTDKKIEQALSEIGFQVSLLDEDLFQDMLKRYPKHENFLWKWKHAQELFRDQRKKIGALEKKSLFLDRKVMERFKRAENLDQKINQKEILLKKKSKKFKITLNHYGKEQYFEHLDEKDKNKLLEEIYDLRFQIESQNILLQTLSTQNQLKENEKKRENISKKIISMNSQREILAQKIVQMENEKKRYEQEYEYLRHLLSPKNLPAPSKPLQIELNESSPSKLQESVLQPEIIESEPILENSDSSAQKKYEKYQLQDSQELVVSTPVKKFPEKKKASLKTEKPQKEKEKSSPQKKTSINSKTQKKK